MFRKAPVSLLAVAFLFCLILVSNAEAQLNFSTEWGKRSQNARMKSDCPSRSTSSLEQLLKLYTFIQVEAQRILDCQNLNK
ncbi:adipokinetic prohormone type 3 [Odontomachus brunneus]|uniref:adipokinetic prohormone type 3 n=1 Tax=Odontomachus brunneus TaxID=486640 RepID=UPI0013F197AB|nr:adipokinetic prohormone type 3 [Odontomachus brunneus]